MTQGNMTEGNMTEGNMTDRNRLKQLAIKEKEIQNDIITHIVKAEKPVVSYFYKKYIADEYYFIQYDVQSDKEICYKLALLFSQYPDCFLGNKITEIQLDHISVSLSINTWEPCKSLPTITVNFPVDYYIYTVNNFPVIIFFRIKKNIKDYRDKLHAYVNFLIGSNLISYDTHANHTNVSQNMLNNNSTSSNQIEWNQPESNQVESGLDVEQSGVITTEAKLSNDYHQVNPLNRIDEQEIRLYIINPPQQNCRFFMYNNKKRFVIITTYALGMYLLYLFLYKVNQKEKLN
jgi:hypothetical protein